MDKILTPHHFDNEEQNIKNVKSYARKCLLNYSIY